MTLKVKSTDNFNVCFKDAVVRHVSKKVSAQEPDVVGTDISTQFHEDVNSISKFYSRILAFGFLHVLYQWMHDIRLAITTRTVS